LSSVEISTAGWPRQQGRRRPHGSDAKPPGGLRQRGAAGIWDLKTTIVEGDSLFLEWGAEGGGNRVEDGIDTFVFRNGLIRVQTVASPSDLPADEGDGDAAGVRAEPRHRAHQPHPAADGRGRRRLPRPTTSSWRPTSARAQELVLLPDGHFDAYVKDFDAARGRPATGSSSTSP
jgi:hypothetical protein